MTSDQSHTLEEEPGSAKTECPLVMTEQLPELVKRPTEARLLSREQPERVERKPPGPFAGKTKSFWLIIAALCTSVLLSAFDLVGVATALPTMAADLKSDKYSWIGTAYALGSTALIPWTAGLAAIFGRRSMMIGCLILFAAGSAITGAGKTMTMVIAGRSVQGIGGGGILVMTDIIICDLVPLVHRGPFYGIIGLTWGLASAVGPTIAGALASSGNWRWLFYLNIPIAIIAGLLVGIFLNVKTPETTFREKMAQMDYANIIFVASATAIIIALSWGGVDHPWNSLETILPIALGVAGIVLFLWIEHRFVKHPTVPFSVLSHRNSFLGYFATWVHGSLILIIAYYWPVWYQSILGASAIRAGVDMFTITLTNAGMAVISGASVTATKKYLPQNALGWALAMVGFGLCTRLYSDASAAMYYGFPVVTGCGLGLVYTAVRFPIMAPLKPDQHPQAMAFFNFMRAFGQVFGIAIGNTVLTNRLKQTLPADFIAQYSANAEVAVPYIASLSEPLRTEVKAAFGESLRLVWVVALCISALGFVATLGFKNVPMATVTDQKWGIDEEKAAKRLSYMPNRLSKMVPNDKKLDDDAVVVELSELNNEPSLP